jgi:hypothetical protein
MEAELAGFVFICMFFMERDLVHMLCALLAFLKLSKPHAFMFSKITVLNI